MKLDKPADIERFKRFKDNVDALIKAGKIRYYTAEISKRTGEDRGNITRYYKGNIPIGDNFMERFEEAYKDELKKIGKPRRHKESREEKTAPLTKAKEIREPYHISPEDWKRMEDRISAIEEDIDFIKGSIHKGPEEVREIILQSFAALQKELKTYIRHKIADKNSDKDENP